MAAVDRLRSLPEMFSLKDELAGFGTITAALSCLGIISQDAYAVAFDRDLVDLPLHPP
jgi:hypothetical protein